MRAGSFHRKRSPFLSEEGYEADDRRGGANFGAIPFTGGRLQLHGWQQSKKRTCAQPVVLAKSHCDSCRQECKIAFLGVGICPKLKSPPLRGGIFIKIKDKFCRRRQRSRRRKGQGIARGKWRAGAFQIPPAFRQHRFAPRVRARRFGGSALWR